jgi:FecR protein
MSPETEGRPINPNAEASSVPRWLALAVAIGAALLGPATPGDAQTAGTAEVILARAPVELLAKGRTAAQPLQKGAKLSEGDRVRTGKGGVAEVVLGDGSLVRVGELSDLEIDKLDVDAANQPTTSRFNLAAGQARAWVARQVVAKVGTGTGRFSVQTPTAVAAVRQTDFALADGRVYTFAGVVETRNVDPAIPGVRLCGRNRYTEVEVQKPPKECLVISLRDKRRLLSPDGLAIEAVFLEPNNLDNVALGVILQKLSLEKMTGTWTSVGPGGSPGRPDAPSEGQALTDVDVIVK